MNTLEQLIWESRYCAREFDEQSPAESYARVARALAANEPSSKQIWEKAFFQLMTDNLFLPAGRILANAGRDNNATLANCFVAGTIEDSLESIFDTLKDCAITLQAGGGIGIDFSPLRPDGWRAVHHSRIASGPVSFLDVWNQMSDTLLRNNPRRGAMIGVLDCSHPDILAFINAKQRPKALGHFNLSVALSDAFMHALDAGEEWPLHFAGKVVAHLPAYEIWQAMLTANLSGGEPGALFSDRINSANRLHTIETIRATNPCGELPLPPHGACLLGSLILPSFVEAAFTERARINQSLLEATVRHAVRMLDNAVDQAKLPLAQQQSVATQSRRIGIGITGLADALIMLGLDYNSDAARATARDIMAMIRNAAYAGSSELAKEKGVFPCFDPNTWLSNSASAPLPADLTQLIQQNGMRNSHLSAIAPTGTLSLLAGNVSSGIEPVFDWSYTRHIGTHTGSVAVTVEDYALQQWRERGNETDLPAPFRRAADISIAAQIKMAAAIQPYVDSAISKTVALPAAATLDDVDHCYRLAYRSGLKGITCFPANSSRGCVLQSDTTADLTCE